MKVLRNKRSDSENINFLFLWMQRDVVLHNITQIKELNWFHFL